MRRNGKRLPAPGVSTGGRTLTAVLAALLSVAIGLFVGFLVLVAINPEHAWKDGFVRILQGGFFDPPYGIGKELSNAAPLIMTGLSVGFAFKTGLFNIGVAGQYVVGMYGALVCALLLHLPWWVCLLAAALFGALWGAIPGLFKAYLNINEVITSIMFNWIGLYAVNEIIYGGGSGAMYDSYQTKTYTLSSKAPSAVIPNLGLADLFSAKSTTIAIFLAMLVAALTYILLQKTTFGYELKAVGLNRNAAKYAGIDEKKAIVLSMVISGAMAGFGAGLYYLSGAAEWEPLDSTALPAMGWNGIAVSLLAANNPIGIIFSAIFISHISVGGTYLKTAYFPTEIASVISGIIIYLCAFSLLFQTWIGRLRRGGTDRPDGGDEEDADADADAPPLPGAAPPEASGEKGGETL